MENKLDRIIDIQELLDMAHRISDLEVTSEDEIAAKGLMVGTVYALLRAATLKYDDARNNVGKDKLATEFSRAANDLSNKLTPQPGWLAGFYFSSALVCVSRISQVRLVHDAQGMHPIPDITEGVDRGADDGLDTELLPQLTRQDLDRVLAELHVPARQVLLIRSHALMRSPV